MILDRIPKFHLTRLETPLQELKVISDHLKGPRIFIKRDDLTDVALGGNKTRKLEYLVADALDQKADTLITAGGIQSNHCRLTAAAAVRAGLRCELVLAGVEPDYPNGNVLLDRLLNAHLNWVTRPEREAEMERVAERLKKQGRKPYVIPVGGSNSIGALGYVNAFLELDQQARKNDLKIDHVIVASSSGGTHAGLQLGARIAGFQGKVTGISIDQVKLGTDSFLPVLARLANETAERLESSERFTENDFHLNCDYLGAGYAVMGDLEREAIQMMSGMEAIVLGPVYTGRAFGGLIDLIQKGEFRSTETVVFWHTGGTPEVFAYNQGLFPA